MAEKLRLRDAKMKKVDKDEYGEQLLKLQRRLLEIQLAYHRQGLRGVIVMEGQDAAGKGGAIKRMTELLDPRGYSVWATSAPTTEEKARHYLQRFWDKFPVKGRFAIFDRSWYGRVLVERVEGFAEKEAWRRAYDEINDMERALVDNGVRLVKIFLHVSKGEQLERFECRLTNPLKFWKISEEDLRNRRRWDDYEVAIDDMFAATSKKRARWELIGADDKDYGRLATLEHVIDVFGEGVDVTRPQLDPALIAAARKELGIKLAPTGKKNRS